MTATQSAPVACTLAPDAYKDRMAWIAALTRDALRNHERRDLVLDLRYAPEARDRVREMVRNEQACCSFLTFDLNEGPDEIRLTVTAPDRALVASLFWLWIVESARPDRWDITGASICLIGAAVILGPRAS